MYKWIVLVVSFIFFVRAPVTLHGVVCDTGEMLSAGIPAQNDAPCEFSLGGIILALIEVESGGDDNAVGDLELEDRAYGCLQIRQPAVTDYNTWNETAHQAEDCLGNRSLSVAICRDYLAHYATPERLGRLPTNEDRVRIWNGGPNGYKKLGTLRHWEKVKKALAKQREG